jgi:hypothetical protein
MPESFMIALSKLEDQTDQIIEKSLKAGGEVVLSKVRGNLRSVIGKGLSYPSRSTGELLSSLGVSPVDIDRNGIHNVNVGHEDDANYRHYSITASKAVEWAT